MAKADGFNGKRFIEITYRRRNQLWRLVKHKVDPQVQAQLGKVFLPNLRKELRRTPNEHRPQLHKRLLLIRLGELLLDQGIYEDCCGGWLTDKQFVKITIIVQKRRQKRAPGLQSM